MRTSICSPSGRRRKIQLEALKLWLQVLGLIGGGRKGVVPPGDQPVNGERNVTGDGPPPRRIHGAEDLTPAQCMESWHELQEDRRKRRERCAQRERNAK